MSILFEVINPTYPRSGLDITRTHCYGNNKCISAERLPLIEPQDMAIKVMI